MLARPEPLLDLPAVAAGGACANCGAAVAGNYCASCGQETLIDTPTVRQFLHELADQYIAVEGKLGRTLRVLLLQPGQLTRDYLEGRRQRYVRPLKLYLSVSVVFFALLGFLPGLMHAPLVHAETPADQKEAAKEAAAEANAAKSEEHDPEDAAAEAFAERIEAGAGKLSKLPAAEQNKVLLGKLVDDGPYAMFLLLPYCALLLRWLFSKNAHRYGVHLLFALHLHCFAFILLAVFLALHVLPGWLLWSAIGVYVFLALRCVYGGTTPRLLWRTSLLAALYLPLMAATAMSGVLGAVLGGKS